MDLEHIATEIHREEGSCLKAYKDSLGKYTVGIGHLLGDEPGAADVVLTPSLERIIFEHDLTTAVNTAEQYPWFSRLNDARKMVIVQMCFQMGSVGKFPKMRAALSADDYEEASDQMLDSLWHRQTPERVERLAAVMRSGVWL